MHNAIRVLNYLAVPTTLLNVCLLLMGAGKHSDTIHTRRIVLESPDKRYSTIIEATNSGTGFWMSNSQGTQVAIYDGFNQGGVIGIWPDDGDEWDALPIAIYATEEGGRIQVIHKDRKGKQELHHVHIIEE